MHACHRTWFSSRTTCMRARRDCVYFVLATRIYINIRRVNYKSEMCIDIAAATVSYMEAMKSSALLLLDFVCMCKLQSMIPEHNFHNNNNDNEKIALHPLA